MIMEPPGARRSAQFLMRCPMIRVLQTSGLRVPARVSFAELFAAGAMSGILGKCAGAPLDRVHMLYQVNPSRDFTFGKAWKTTKILVQKSGPLSLWRGNAATMWRVMPYSGIQFATFETLDKSLEGHVAHSFSRHVLAGGCAGAVATMITYPADVVHARMAADWNVKPLFTSTFQGIKKIQALEGTRVLYRGALPTLFGVFPYSGLGFAIFHSGKGAICRARDWEDKEIPFAWRFGVGGMAGLVGLMAAYPFSTVRRRVQIGAPVGLVANYNILTQIHSIIKKEGLRRGLFKGASLTIIKGPVAVAVALNANDYLKRLVNRGGDDPLVVPMPHYLHVNYEKRPKEKKKITTIENLICGAFAGSLAKTVIAPGDRVKILYQTNTDRIFSFRNAIKTGRNIVQHSGWTGLWRGHAATLLTIAPKAGITFTLFPRFRDRLEEYTTNITFSRFVAGSCASVVGTTIVYPLDMLRARMAAHWSTTAPHVSYTSAVKSLVKERGVLSLYAGLRPTLLGIVPYSGFSFTIFESLKQLITTRRGLEDTARLETPWRLGAGAIAGLSAQSITYPLDIIRRRMQVHPDIYRNEWHAFRKILATEGYRGHFKGLSMNWVKGPIAISVSFSLNDLLQNTLMIQGRS
eukprot:GEMP01020680.1.p1 GENE.GEMP01020680.1~~GEMP01020680.1.p1  ORF type:complete len:634 (+),score=86.85 GEMP01020680.1:147-2048(+)